MNILLFIILAIGALRAHVDIPMAGAGDIQYSSEGLKRKRGELRPPQEHFSLEELNRVLYRDLKIQSDQLKRIKYHLLNGQIRLASAQLSKLAFDQTKLRPIIYRYLGILHFIDGDYEKSLDYLSKKELRYTPNYQKVCLLKTLNLIVLNYNSKLGDEWGRCKSESSKNLQENNLMWMDVLVALKTNPRPGITQIPFRQVKLAAFNTDQLKVMMKLALYLNQEKLLLTELPNLTLEQLQDPEVRELAGHIYFRSGSLAKSYRFVEDLKSPNAENIKGNLYILRNKYELAYAQFKLALEQKQNSQNALERLLPLAWLLGDWESGGQYAERILSSPETFMNKLTLTAAFLVQKGDFQDARRHLDIITERSRKGTEIDVTQLYSFIALMQNRPVETRKYANLSCTQYDLVNCWLLFQLSQWDSFTLTIRREESIVHKKNWERLITEDINEPLKEVVYVNQLDIEEMDDKELRLIPEKTP